MEWYYILLVCVTCVCLVYSVLKLYLKLTCGVCTCTNQMQGKTVIITGANTGIGFETAKDLASRGAKVILACRDLDKASRARYEIISDTPNATVICKHLDLASFKSVRCFAEDILSTEPRIDVLINNAGGGGLGNKKSEDGLQLLLQINHFGPFLLTNLLLDRLRQSAPSRIVMVASLFHKYAKVDMENITMDGSWSDPFTDITLYNNSKLFNIVTANELSRRLNPNEVVVNSVHPGVVRTEIHKKMNRIKRLGICALPLTVGKSPKEGAQTTIHLTVSPELAQVTGQYFSDCKPAAMSAKATDIEFAKKIWQLSEELVQIYP